MGPLKAASIAVRQGDGKLVTGSQRTFTHHWLSSYTVYNLGGKQMPSWEADTLEKLDACVTSHGPATSDHYSGGSERNQNGPLLTTGSA